MNQRPIAGSALPLALALGLLNEVPDRPRNGERRQRAAAPTRRPRAPRPGPETKRLPCPHATAALELDGRVWQHRQTGEIRGACWTPAGVEFHNPQTDDVFVRPFRKALQWCAEAVDVTPSDAEMVEPEGSAGGAP